MPDPLIRTSKSADQPALDVLERRHFPAQPGKPHSGYLLGDNDLARASLDDGLAAPHRSLVSVAEIDGTIEGFALAFPFSLPGNGALDPNNMLLQYLAVNENHRRQGIGVQLLEHLEERIKPHRQNVIVAHVPEAEAEFYRRAGWEVMAPTAGFAWLAFNDFLRADYPDPQIGYEHLAAKILRPRAIRRWYGFPRVTNAPVADATIILELLIERGDLDMADLDEGTAQMLAIGRLSRSFGRG
jgi:GNAT superfamily N-acetyltransferase